MALRAALIAGAIAALAVLPSAWAAPPVTVSYRSPAALRGLDVIRRIDRLHVAQVSTADVAALRARPGILWAEAGIVRARQLAPASAAVGERSATAFDWQVGATRADLVPASAERAAARITIAVVDTGADMTAPDLAAKCPITHNVITGGRAVSDPGGHGTLVASLAAGSATNGAGIAGFGGDARLMIVQASRDGTTFSDVDEAAGIVWAVDHGARIVNLSIGGTRTSRVERRAIAYAIRHGVLLVAAAGNYGLSNRSSYPAALLGSHGIAVAASTPAGTHADFSTAARYVSIAAPGVRILGAVSASSPTSEFPRAVVPGATGVYGYGTGTSYSAPLVAGAAALVWAANPKLTADEVVRVLAGTAAGAGAWTPQLGFGVLDVAAAVADARGAGR